MPTVTDRCQACHWGHRQQGVLQGQAPLVQVQVQMLAAVAALVLAGVTGAIGTSSPSAVTGFSSAASGTANGREIDAGCGDSSCFSRANGSIILSMSVDI